MREPRLRQVKGVYRRKDGRYDWQIVSGRDPATGNPKKLARGICRTQKEAEEARNEALVKLHLGQPTTEGKQTVGEFLDYWIAEHVKGTLAPKTERIYGQIVRLYIKPAIGHIQLTKLTAAQLHVFESKLKRAKRSAMRKDANGKPVAVELEPLTARTVLHVRRVLSAALKRAVKQGRIRTNPVENLDVIPVPEAEPVYLSVDEVRNLLKETRGHYLANAIRVSLFTGLRIGELTGLRWEDIDFEARQVHIRHQLQRVQGIFTLSPPKSRRSRRVLALTETCLNSLKDQRAGQLLWKAVQDSDQFNELGLVITTTEGRPVDPKLFNTHLKRFIEKAGITKTISAHKLRHTNATHMAAAGVDIQLVADQLGHTSIGLTKKTYSHAVPTALRDAAEKLEQAYGCD